MAYPVSFNTRGSFGSLASFRISSASTNLPAAVHPVRGVVDFVLRGVRALRLALWLVFVLPQRAVDGGFSGLSKSASAAPMGSTISAAMAR